MNLQPLFETQKILDQRIVEQHGLEGQDLLAEKILALQVELGECSNEWRGFKYWKVDAKPNTRVRKECDICAGDGIGSNNLRNCANCGGSGKIKTNPLLEEYVDSLHFILSIGLDLGCEGVRPAIRKTVVSFKGDELTAQFNEVMYRASSMSFVNNKKTEYQVLIGNFLGLGEMLGFAWDQIEQAYYSKNEINHTRQATGY